MVSKQIGLFFDCVDEVLSKKNGRDFLIFLDYDGTLTPIVETPDLAIISDEIREKVNALSEKYTTAIVSGRATDDVSSKVNLPHLNYAGSHGFEILFSDGHREIVEEAQKLTETVNDVHQLLSEKLSHIKGALVEHVKFTVTAHYRLVEDGSVEEFRKIVQSVIKDYPDLRLTEGKKVLEVRPSIDWHKGKAVARLTEILDSNKKCIPVYIGDDTTDEDAFREIQNKGIGILVSDFDKETQAHYRIKDTEEVGRVLDWLKQT